MSFGFVRKSDLVIEQDKMVEALHDAKRNEKQFQILKTNFNWFTLSPIDFKYDELRDKLTDILNNIAVIEKSDRNVAIQWAATLDPYEFALNMMDRTPGSMLLKVALHGIGQSLKMRPFDVILSEQLNDFIWLLNDRVVYFNACTNKDPNNWKDPHFIGDSSRAWITFAVS